MKKIIYIAVVLVWIIVGVYVYIDKRNRDKQRVLPEELKELAEEYSGDYHIKDEVYVDKNGVIHISNSCPEYKERDYDIPIEMIDARMIKDLCYICTSDSLLVEFINICRTNDPDGTDLYLELDIE